MSFIRTNIVAFHTNALIEAIEARRLFAVVPAASADAFVESVGVNGGGGGETVTDYQRIRDYGFRHLRTSVVRYEDPNWVATHNQGYDQTGLRWLMTINKEPTPAELVSFYKQYTPGSIAMLEGNNEVDNTAFYGNGYEAVAQAAQPGYWDALKADPATRDTPLAIYSTTYGDWRGYTTTKADFGNLHYYPGAQRAPLFVDGINDFQVNRNRMDNALAGPEKGFIVGEAGYSVNRFGPMSRAAQAKADSMLVAEYFKQGVPRSFVFSFYGSNEGFELYSQPAGNALKGLLTTLGEATWNDPANTWNRPSFSPGALDFTITGGNDSVRSQLLQKSNGDFYLMLWQSKGVSDGNGNDINNADVNVTLNFKTPLNATAVVSRLTPSTGLYSTSNATIGGSGGNQSLTVGVPDSVMLIKLDPTAASPFAQTGTIYQEVWTGVGGTAVSSVPVQNAPDQVNTLTQLEGTFGGDNYGSRTRGYITAPTDGLYTFWISGDDNVEFRLSRSPDGARDVQTIATVPGYSNYREWNKFAEQKSVPIALLAGRKYYFEVLQKEGGGGDSVSVGWAKPGEAKTAPSQVVPGSALSPVGTPLPTGWMNADVGRTDLPGTASESGGTFALQGNGSDIWNNADQFHFAYKSQNGNGDLIARVSAQQNTDGWAKSGVMFRDGIGAGDSFAGLFVTPSNGIQFQYRNGNGTNAQGAGGTGGVAAPVWLKLSRSGDAFTASYSLNGTSWTQVGSPTTVAIATNAKAGLAALSHNVLTTGSATFTNVSVGTGGAPAPGTTLYNNDFESTSIGSSPTGWTTAGGTWSVQQPPGNSRDFRTGGGGLSTYTAAGSAWDNYSAQVDVNPGSDTGGASLLVRAQSANRFYQVEFKNNSGTKQVNIWKNDNGNWSQVAAWNFNWSAGGWYRLNVALSGSTFTVSVGGTVLGTATDGTWLTGGVGLRTDSMAAGFDNLLVVQG